MRNCRLRDRAKRATKTAEERAAALLQRRDRLTTEQREVRLQRMQERLA